MRIKFLLTISCGLILHSAACRAAEPYKFIQEIPIGGEGGWDILTIDPGAHRLYLAHSTKVVVVDLEKNSVAGEIVDTPGVHGFAVAPELRRGFSTNGAEAKVSVVDLISLKTLAKVETGEGPDAIVYDPQHAKVYVFNHRGNSATVIDAKTNKVVSTIPLGGSPEFGVVDGAAGRVYVNLEDKNEVAVIDQAKHEVVAHWALAPGTGPSGLAFDSAHHRLFAACEKEMVMLDTESGKVAGTVPIAEGADGCEFDSSMQLAFASCRAGTTTIAKEEMPDRLTVVQTLQTERGARTMSIDPTTHRIYLPSAQFEAPPAPSAGASPGRPKIVPGSLKLLVYGPTKANS